MDKIIVQVMAMDPFHSSHTDIKLEVNTGVFIIFNQVLYHLASKSLSSELTSTRA